MEIFEEIKRSELPNSAFGLPEERKYPLDTREHVVSAIRLFGHCPEDKKKELSQRIRLAAKKYDVEIKDTMQVHKYFSESGSEYDSTIDAKKHIANISKVMNTIIADLEKRKIYHDASKLEDPERSCYDKYIPLLKEEKYGSPGYEKIRKEMQKDGMDHHFKVNRHHPEHFEDGINDMTIVDLVEMYCDWKAASMRSDVGFKEGLKMNRKKYKISEQLYRIFLNTEKEYFE